MKKALLFFPVAALLCVLAFSGASDASTYDAGKLYIENAYDAASRIDLSIANVTTGDGVLEFYLEGSGDAAYDGVWTVIATDSDGIDLKGLNNGFRLDFRLTWGGNVLAFSRNVQVKDFEEDDSGLFATLRWDTDNDEKFTVRDKDVTVVMASPAVLAIPVPPSALLFASGLVGLASFKKRAAIRL